MLLQILTLSCTEDIIVFLSCWVGGAVGAPENSLVTGIAGAVSILIYICEQYFRVATTVAIGQLLFDTLKFSKKAFYLQFLGWKHINFSLDSRTVTIWVTHGSYNNQTGSMFYFKRGNTNITESLC